MSNLISPMPTGVLPGSGYWNDWVEKLRILVNGLLTQISWNNIVDKPTTIAGYGIIDPIELTTHKDQPNGYAGLNSVSRIVAGVVTIDDVIVDTTAKGLVLKSPNGHYWRFSVNNTGVVATTDLGTTLP